MGVQPLEDVDLDSNNSLDVLCSDAAKDAAGGDIVVTHESLRDLDAWYVAIGAE